MWFVYKVLLFSIKYKIARLHVATNRLFQQGIDHILLFTVSAWQTA